MDSVLISWTVDEITYTPETYTVLFGENSDSLLTETAQVLSVKDRQLRNVSYQFLIENLELGKKYYYKIVSENEYKTENSVVKDFSAGELVPLLISMKLLQFLSV